MEHDVLEIDLYGLYLDLDSVLMNVYNLKILGYFVLMNVYNVKILGCIELCLRCLTSDLVLC